MRNKGRLKLGYFPLPPSEGPRIRACLSFPPQASVLDPCAGTGAALLQVTEGTGVTRYALELDADRAEACASFRINTLHANTIEVSGKSQQVSMLYLNPPYDFECGLWDNRRLEYVFLQHCYRWLVLGGVLVFVVPQNALDSCNRILSDRFANLQVFQLSDHAAVKYDQIVIFGVRKDQSDRNSNNTQYMLRQMNWGRLPIEPLPDGGIPNGYNVPKSNPVATFSCQGLDFDTLEDLLPTSIAWHRTKHALLPDESITSGRPLTPLHGGHVGLLCTAGLMNGAIGEGENRHIAKWRTLKVATTIDEGVNEDGAQVTRTIERFARDLAIVFQDGRVQALGEEPPKTEEKTADLPVTGSVAV